ncbi:MAG: 50S ribosomal protein L10 [bacterium]
MNRQEKEKVVSDFGELFVQSKAAFLVDYKGLNVPLTRDFRKQLRDVDGVFRVMKARLMKKAAQNVAQEVGGVDAFQEHFKNQVGVVFANGDVSSLAKKLVNFSKETENLRVLSALFESRVMTKEDVVALASLPSRDVLLAMLLLAMRGPTMHLTHSLQALLTQFVYSLEQISNQKSE